MPGRRVPGRAPVLPPPVAPTAAAPQAQHVGQPRQRGGARCGRSVVYNGGLGRALWHRGGGLSDGLRGRVVTGRAHDLHLGRRPGPQGEGDEAFGGEGQEAQDERVHVAASPPVRIGKGMLHGGEVQPAILNSILPPRPTRGLPRLLTLGDPLRSNGGRGYVWYRLNCRQGAEAKRLRLVTRSGHRRTDAVRPARGNYQLAAIPMASWLKMYRSGRGARSRPRATPCR